ncbi:MAG: FAD-dependent oxidoreductase, partial [Raoultella planticola]
RQRSVTVDAVVAAAGLRPETALARHAGLLIRRGVVVNSRLQTSDPAIYALGDCAEINGSVLPFLQPILLSAMCLAKNLLSQASELTLPPMLVKVKTPDLPLHLAGDTRREDLTWHIVAANDGLVAKGVDAENQLRAFVVSEERMKEAFALLKQLIR